MVQLWTLLAESRSYRSSGGSQYVLLIVGLAVVAAIIAAIYFLNNRRKPAAKEENAGPENLFEELCNSHGLSRSERSLLNSVAQSQRLPHPAQVFVDPKLLDRAATGDSRCQALSQKLFGDLQAIEA